MSASLHLTLQIVSTHFNFIYFYLLLKSKLKVSFYKFLFQKTLHDTQIISVQSHYWMLKLIIFFVPAAAHCIEIIEYVIESIIHNIVRHESVNHSVCKGPLKPKNHQIVTFRHYLVIFIWCVRTLQLTKLCPSRQTSRGRNKPAILDGRSTNLPTGMKSQLWYNGSMSTSHVVLLLTIEFHSSISESERRVTCSNPEADLLPFQLCLLQR